jgi:peptide/nickel transport system permease protein
MSTENNYYSAVIAGLIGFVSVILTSAALIVILTLIFSPHQVPSIPLLHDGGNLVGATQSDKAVYAALNGRVKTLSFVTLALAPLLGFYFYSQKKISPDLKLSEIVKGFFSVIGIFFKALRRNKSGFVGFIGLSLFLLMLIFGPLVVPYSNTVRQDEIAAPPGSRVQMITLSENADQYKTLDDLKGKRVAIIEFISDTSTSEALLGPYVERGEIEVVGIQWKFENPVRGAINNNPFISDEPLPHPAIQVLNTLVDDEADAALLFSELIKQYATEANDEELKAKFADIEVSNPSFGPRHLLGTDTQGRDIYNHIVNGGETLIITAVLAGFFSTLIAIVLGASAGLLGGAVDRVFTTAANFVLTIPGFPLLVVLAALLGDKLSNFVFLAALIAALSWPVLMRAIRSQVLSLREREFVEAARALDLGLPHIIMREILPNMMSFVAISFIFAITGAMYQQVGLIFLGMADIEVSTSNWGVMLTFGRSRGTLFSTDSASMVISPIIAIALFQVCMVLFARALEEMFDPRLRTS